ncbi:preATP grasp domain-containing protein [Streptomyces sp. NPDC003758]
MGTLVISNLGRLITGHPDDVGVLGPPAAFQPPYLRYLQAQAHRTVWFARPGDVLLVPTPVDGAFLRHATALRGFTPDDLDVLVHEPGAGFAARLREAVRRRGVDRAWPYYHDRTAAALIRGLGLPVAGFAAQGGAELLNSKVMFRALAAGAGVPVAEGRVPVSRADAEGFVRTLLADGRSAVVKQDFHVGGLGNEIASPAPGLLPIGANRVETCTDEEAVARFVARQWGPDDAPGRPPIVVEHYVPDCRSVYAGYRIGERGVSLYGHGEMRMTPVINGLITPSPSAGTAEFAPFLRHAERLAGVVRALGYRGQLSVDGVLTPDGDTFLTEINARSGGATHDHCILRTLVGRDDRVLVDRRRCDFPPLGPLLAELHAQGLAFDPVSRTGVVVTVHDGGTGSETGEFAVIAEDLAAAEQAEKAVEALLHERDGDATASADRGTDTGTHTDTDTDTATGDTA